MSERRFRVLAVASHPVQYSAPIFRLMAQHPRLDFHVAYCTLRGAEAAHDPEFGQSVKWDVPLLNGYEWTHVPNRGTGSQGFWGLYNPGLWPMIRSDHFDAVISYTGYPTASFWISWLAAKTTRTAFLFGTDTVTLTPLDGRIWKRPVKRLVWPSLFRLADQIIVPSSGTRDLMLSLGIPEDRVSLTPYVVDNDWWIAQSAAVDRQAVRELWSVEPEDRVILFCAKLQPWKRPLDLLRAFAEAGLPRAVLVFAGDGPLRSVLEAKASELGVSSQLRFLGFVNQTQLPSVYTAADLLVLPSEYDAFGVVVNEAMLCGCPVITSDRVGAAQDLLAPVSPELIFPCGDIKSLASLLAKLAADPLSLKRLGQLGFSHMQTWRPQRNVSATIAAVERAVARVRRHEPEASPDRNENSASATSDKGPTGSSAFSKLSSRKSHPE